MTQPTTLSPTDAARWLRKDLRKAFPGCKFSLTGSRGTGYGYYDCRWTGGPSEEEVREIVRPYQGSYFDGMTDCEVGIATAVGIASDGGVLRKVTTPLWEYDGQFVYTYSETKPVYGVCSGDSGGAAAMRREQDDKWELVGVNSFVWNDNGSTTIDCNAAGTGSAASRIDRNLDFLGGFIEIEEEVHEGDADVDADSDTDTDSDADSDSDTDIQDSAFVDSGLDGTPTDKNNNGTGLCAPVGAPAWLLLPALVAMVGCRRA